MKDLEAKGMIKVRWVKGPGESTRCTLTKLGEKVAESIWKKTPDVKEIVQKTKEELCLIEQATKCKTFA